MPTWDSRLTELPVGTKTVPCPLQKSVIIMEQLQKILIQRVMV
jgi:hypothetical protein